MERKLRKSKHWWRVPLQLLMFLIGGISSTWASTANFATSSYTKVVSGPTLARPCFTVQILFYDADSNDSFFCHNKTEGNNKGPAVYVDGNYICSPDYELAWPDSSSDDGGDGSGKACWEDCNTYDKWWGDGYSKTVNGITYTVKFWNPKCNDNSDKTSGQRTVQMLVFISKMQVNSDHNIRVKGRWKTNSGSIDWREVTFSTTATDTRLKLSKLGSLGVSSPSAVMTAYDKMEISGNLKADYGPTTVGTYSGATSSGLGWTDNLTSYCGPFNKGLATFTGEVKFDERTNFWNSETKYVEYIVTDKATIENTTMPEVKIYQWYPVTAAGFVRAKSISYTKHLYDKYIHLEWTADETGGRSKAGTWSIYRGTTLLKSGISYDDPWSYDDTSSDLAYDSKYIYKVVFVPTGSPAGTTRKELTCEQEVDFTRPQSFFSNLSASNTYEDKIIFSWSHSGIENASGTQPINLTVERSSDNKQTWTTMKTIPIDDPNTTGGSFEDRQDLQLFVTYFYRLRINVMGKTYETEPITGQLEGMSKVTEFTATRGTYSNMVKLRWMVKQVGTNTTYFTLYRRPLGSTNERDWAEVYSTSGTAASYSYDDVTALPGSFNEYKVAVWMMNGETQVPGLEETVDGFSVATGVISGRITYGTGAAVSDAKVTLKQQTTDGKLSTGMHALRLSGAGAGLKYQTDTTTIRQLYKDDFTVQMYLNPVSEEMNQNNTSYIVFDSYNVFSLYLIVDTQNNRFQLQPWLQGYKHSGVYIPGNQWSHVTVVFKRSADSQLDDSLKVVVHTPDTTITKLISAKFNWTDKAKQANNIVVGNVAGMDNTNNYRGFIDEVRFFTKALSDKEIAQNYNHPLAGNEPNLAIYYPLDEGIASQTLAYDFSKTNGAANGRHASAKVPATSVDQTPSENQLSLMAYTDSIGNYTVRGVPFSGEGTSYTIIPTLGIHEFSPSAQSRFVSMSSLNHSGVDFEDVSSFPVSGKVYYAGTDFPVEGAFFYVDGTICAKDGEVIQTGEDGSYTISVPIGDHFIRVEKSGHVFADGGRYPADPNNTGNKVTFDDEKKNMDFFDKTLVNFTGRIVGGSIQGNKPVGFGLSNNNLGVSRIVLSPQDDTYRLNVVKKDTLGTFKYVNNEKTVDIASSTERIASTSYRNGGKTIPDCQKIIIETDPETGEFSAMLPPLKYSIDSLKVKKSNMKVGDSMTIDLTNPNYILSDTLYNDDRSSYELYEYNTKVNQVYHADATFTVKQQGRDDGSFGIDSYTLTDEQGELKIDNVYSVKNGTVSYNYGVTDHKAPLFVQGDPYTFLIEGYEEYINADNDVVDHVPLVGNVVTISNALSSEQKVYFENIDEHKPGDTAGLEENQLVLDDNGKATYKWKAGLPNISEPYTRTISILYDIDGRLYPWSGDGMEGIILGSLPTGNNFVTAGPEKVTMVLRDPPGTNSFAEWKSGSTKTTSKVTGTTFHESAQLSFKHRFGFEKAIVIGTGIATVESIESCDDLEVGAKTEYENESSTTWTETTSVTKTISTSAAPEYVGAQGDVFIGNSTNLIFGKVRNLDLRRQATGTVDLGLDDIIQTSIDFKTMFMYTQNYIENVMLPNYELMRKNFLKTKTQKEIDSYVNNTDHTVYLTTLTPENANFGTEGTYKIFKSSQDAYCEDSVAWINQQVTNWKDRLHDNEMEKVKAFQNRKKYLVGDNLSFDSGSTYNYETTVENDTTTTRDWTISGGLVLDNTFGLAINSFGFNIHIQDETFGGEHHVTDTLYHHERTFSFTLAEDGDDDALSVDVLKYGNHGLIFRTRGGQTCCPYEGKTETKYYKPGTTIMEATMQIEVPKINVDVPILSDIPTGSTADYTLRLSNNSEIDEDVYYRLLVDDESNPYGANLMIDGRPVTDSRIIKIPAGQTVTKQLQLKQTNTSILDYENIAVVLASQCQFDPTSTWDVISDTIRISAHFVPSSSPVDFALSNTTMNTRTGTNLDLTFSGFDRNYRGLKAFRLQYKKPGNSNWTILHEYVTDKGEVSQSKELLPATGASVTYHYNMSDPDGDYLFRCVSVSTYGNDEIYRYSDEIALTKDMRRPTPLGLPEPTDGILSAGDEISVTFNETILRGKLTKEANFFVTGVLNGSEIAHETALSMQNTETTAQTEASITLAGKDFSIDTWVNINGAGTILSHGSGASKMTIGTNANGQLVVTLGNNTYTSNASVPTAKWAFLTLSYAKADAGGNLSASVASDDKTITLFNGIAVAAYEGAGPIAVGKNHSGAIHELLLWDEAHDLSTALLNRSKTKNPSTRHLIGYWKMDEGEGTSIRDYARNRHMTMSAETWYLNNVNKAVALSGSNYLTVPTADLGIFSDDDYAVEFWMRSDKQTAETQLLQMGDVALWMNAAGQLQLTGKQAYNDADATVLATNSPNLTDNAWHHVALNVLRQGAAAVYVDGQRVLTTNASNVGTIASDRLLMGVRRTTFATGIDYSYDRLFKGQIDELRIWGATLNAEKLSSNRKVRLGGKESGLMAYFPFEEKGLDGNNQPITLTIPDDLTGSGKVAQLVTPNSEPTTLNYTDEAPALRTKPTETNVSFTYVASDTKIVINIDEDPATIEGTTLNFSVQDVSDKNGNYSLPAVWSAFVNCNTLIWKDEDLAVDQKVNSSSTVTATIVNKGGTMQMWTLSGIPAWMTASTESGTTNPLAETKVTFTVTEATPIGKYEETIYLTGTDGIEVPLTIRVTVKGEEPDWAVNESDYEGSMNLIGSLDILGIPSEDADDIVAAFIGDECRGVAHPVYNKYFDFYFLMMDIYGNGSDAGKEVTFKVYDASTGETYPVVQTSKPVKLESNTLVGDFDNPLMLSAVNVQEQILTLGKGWTWFSLYVEPDNMSIPAVFAPVTDAVSLVKDQRSYLSYANGTWTGKNFTLTNLSMYQVKMNEARTITLTGKKVNPQEKPISLSAGWNWVAYNVSQTMSVTDALADMSPQDGDYVKGQSKFATYRGGIWMGTLTSLVPGQGYMIKVSDSRTFRYPKAAATANARLAFEYEEQPAFFTPVDFHYYADNMTVIARVMTGGQPASGMEVGVFAGEECRAAGISNDEGLVFLTIPGDARTQLAFRMADGDTSVDCDATLEYTSNAITGTLDEPFILNALLTGISNLNSDTADSEIYDLQGRRVHRQAEGVQRSTLKKGVYIENGQKRVKK
ncbi:MAG: LamG domain-containing protein [Prevotella sp.]|nr:LamG domain-containing protein [Prevotella sp.]